MTREYRETVVLRGDVDLDSVQRISDFVEDKASAECRLVTIELTDGRIKGPSLAEARGRR